MCGVLSSRAEHLVSLLDELSSRFGAIDYQGGPLPFDFTGYYNDEMGVPISRYFVAFKELVIPDTLADIKVLTNEIENRYADGGKRRINLDPGLISLKRLILASTKDNGRRVPLSKGIYAEITLVFIDGAFQPVPWTYPDYRSDAYIEMMGEIREMYKSQLKRL